MKNLDTKKQIKILTLNVMYNKIKIEKTVFSNSTNIEKRIPLLSYKNK